VIPGFQVPIGQPSSRKGYDLQFLLCFFKIVPPLLDSNSLFPPVNMGSLPWEASGFSIPIIGYWLFHANFD
jgi:hypothetical protein